MATFTQQLAAYDYDAPEWVFDQDRARALLLDQYESTLALLTGASGPEFFQATRKRGDQTTYEQAIELTKLNIARLRDEEQGFVT